VPNLSDVFTYLLVALPFVYIWYLSMNLHRQTDADSRTSFSAPKWVIMILAYSRDTSFLNITGVAGQMLVISFGLFVIQYNFDLSLQLTLELHYRPLFGLSFLRLRSGQV